MKTKKNPKYRIPKVCEYQLGTIAISKRAIKNAQMKPEEFVKMMENRRMKTKKKPTDATLRNVRATKKRMFDLEHRINRDTKKREESLERRILALERIVQELSRSHLAKLWNKL